MSNRTTDNSSGRRSGMFYILVLLVVVVYLFPFYWMVISSLKTQIQNNMFPPLFFFKPTFDNYINVFDKNPFLLYLTNSLIIAFGSTFLGLLFGLPAAYGIARYRQKRLGIAVLLARIAPGISYLVPWFIIFSAMNMVGSYAAIILSHLTVSLPLTIWIMIGFFEDIPSELEDAALVDGASIFTVFAKIALPLVTPGIATASILSFIQSWNTFMYSVVLADSDTRTLPVAVFGFLSYGGFDWGGLTAAATVITVPVMILAILMQRYIVSGLTTGGIKS